MTEYFAPYRPETCGDPTHVDGCPGAAGGDHDPRPVEVRLSMLRCSECGDLLDSFGCCVIHGLLDTEVMDGYDQPPDMNREGDPAFNGAFDRW